MTKAHVLGFPRIGPDRETKKAVEAFWQGKISREELVSKTNAVKKDILAIQKTKGLDLIAIGDYTMYDHILDLNVMLGVVPERFGSDRSDLIDLTFKMGRGNEAPALAMTKWFDTNYHYMVPEFKEDTRFSLNLNDNKILQEVKDAIASGYPANTLKPVITGPVTYLFLGKISGDAEKKIKLLENLLPQYVTLLTELKKLGVEWVQLDEPLLGLECSSAWQQALKSAYHTIVNSETLKVLCATYFTGVAGANLDLAVKLEVDGIHLDFVRDNEGSLAVAEKLRGSGKVVSVGVVNGRNIWKNDLEGSLAIVEKVKSIVGSENVWVSSSCSLLHSPVDLNNEKKISPEIKQWLAFAVQKVEEVVVISKKANGVNDSSVKEAFEASKAAIESRRKSNIVHNAEVKKRVSTITKEMFERRNPYEIRAGVQRQQLKLPDFPTTTIGSFPQTLEIRRTRNAFKSGKISEAEYVQKMEEEIKDMVAKQEELGIDVLVHGEPERNDMVEYFGELLQGFTFSQNGWVQSYGSRCVKPPIIFGDIWRKNPMTVSWIKYAQSLSSKPMKGMLTGPVTILCWSFEREDISMKETAYQIALALRDEVIDLEKAGIKVVQIDEPAFREGLPLKKSEQPEYLKWAVDAFKLSSGGNEVDDSLQIHTHMCYSEFNVIIDSVANMDADVITIETSRNDMKLLDAFETFHYPNEIGPGVYDIHSPRIPTLEEMLNLMKKAKDKIDFKRLWINPDCGLKTRGWKEVMPALERMVETAKQMRTLVTA